MKAVGLLVAGDVADPLPKKGRGIAQVGHIYGIVNSVQRGMTTYIVTTGGFIKRTC